MPVKDLAQPNAHWYELLVVALSVDAENQLVEIHILARKAKQLAYPSPVSSATKAMMCARV